MYIYGYVGVHMDMLVGLGNASFLMIHKFTEKRQEVDDRCAHGEEPGILWEEHQDGSKGDVESGAEAQLRAHFSGTGRTQSPVALWEVVARSL